MDFDSGMPAAEVLEGLKRLRDLDPPTHGGKVLAYVYDPGIADLDDLMGTAAGKFLPVNGLDPTTFASVAVLERDVVAFAREITGGDDEVVGSVTSGGTESCLLAVKSARDLWRAQNDRTTKPAIIAPTTVHAAFHKACEYFDLTMIAVDIDPETGSVDPQTFIAAVDAQIEAHAPPALVVLSAPNYPIGSIDDIARIAPAMAQRGIPVHVDACVGGFVLPFYPGAVPEWDFSVEGVRSISLDLHKYGYAPKGASVVLYRGREHHHAQYFATVSWPGYPVVNPTMLGSKSATALAAGWAIIHRLGKTGYRHAVARIAAATDRVTDVLQDIPGLKILGTPMGPLIAVTSAEGPDAVDPFNFIDALKADGFLAQAQPAFRNIPRSAHLTITPVTADVIGDLTGAIRSAAAQVRGKPAPEADLTLVERIAEEGLPEDQAQVMATLEALPPDFAPQALIQVLAGVIDPDIPAK